MANNEEIFRKLHPTKAKRFYNWFRLRLNKFVLETELRKWLAYQDDYATCPKMYEGDENEVSNSIFPWMFSYMASLIKATGWTEEQVIIMPVGKVLWYNLAFNYLETGETRVVSDKEQQAQEALKAMMGGK